MGEFDSFLFKNFINLNVDGYESLHMQKRSTPEPNERGSWTYDWDTTQGPNGVFALISRATDQAGNITTDQVNVIVDNAPPTVTLTESWSIWETARGSVFKNVIPLGSKKITVDCDEQPDRVIEYNANEGAFDFKWDRRCGDGNLAPSGSYTVVLEACDIYHNCDEARGKVDIPFVAAIIVPPTSTPMPTLENVDTDQIWYSTPTPIPSYTPTPQEAVLPMLPATGGDDSGDNNVPTGSNQPLLPLAAAALGTSVLLAASSKREEREAQAAARLEEMQNASTAQQAQNQAARETCVAAQTVATVNEETPYVEVSTLAALAGVVKETFEGVWEDAVRISPADAPTVHIYTNWVNGVDPIAYYEENGARLAAKAKFWNDYWIASQKKYIEQLRIEAKIAAEETAKRKAEAKAAQMTYDDYAEQMRLIASTGGRAITDLSQEQMKEYVNQSAGSGMAAGTYVSTQLAAYKREVEQREKEARDYSNQVKTFHEAEEASNKSYDEYQAYHDKLTQMEEATEEKNVITPNPTTQTSSPMPGLAAAMAGVDYSGKSVFTPDKELQEVIDTNIAKQVEGKPTVKDIFVNFLNSASTFAGNVYDAFRTPTEIRNYKENYGPVSASFGGAAGSYAITNDGKTIGGYTVEQVKGEYNTEMSESAAAFTLSMIPFVGDGSGILKELYNLYMTGEMDELNFTLSVIGLAMDLPFDGGILGDTAVATLKAVSAMIPSGPVRQVMLEALQQVGKNPEGLIAMAGAFGKMAGNDDLLKIVTSNPEVFKAYLNGGAEAAENLLKCENEIIKVGNAFGADELIDIMEGGKGALHSTDEIAEVGTKVVANSGDEVVEADTKAMVNRGDEAAESGGKSLIEQGNFSSGDATFMDSDDKFLEYIGYRGDVDVDGYYDIIAHGTTDGIEITHNGKKIIVDSRTASRLIQNIEGYNGQSVRLLSCNTGKIDSGFAQNLANKLNIEVYAPNNYLWATSNGDYFVAGMTPDGLPDLSDMGDFILFTPGN
jgi:hypothetical protein